MSRVLRRLAYGQRRQLSSLILIHVLTVRIIFGRTIRIFRRRRRLRSQPSSFFFLLPFRLEQGLLPGVGRGASIFPFLDRVDFLDLALLFWMENSDGVLVLLPRELREVVGRAFA